MKLTVTHKIVIGLVTALVFLNASLTVLFYKSLGVIAEDTRNTLERTVASYGDLDLDNLCRVVNCKAIETTYGGVYSGYRMKGSMLASTRERIYSENTLEDDEFVLTEDFSLILKEPHYEMTIEVDKADLIESNIEAMLIVDLVACLFFILVSYVAWRVNRHQQMIQQRNLGEALRDKNMKTLTENILHELGTPVAIIKGTATNIEHNMRYLDTTIGACKNGSVCKAKMKTVSLGDIFDALERIQTVLDRMNDFKQITHSNGNKTLYEIISAPANNMQMYKHCNFIITVPDELAKYSVSGKLTNGDIMNIFSSHFKNSIEAGGSAIRLETNVVDNMMSVFIIDNGKGLRDPDGHPLQRKDWDNIFKEGYSTKDRDGNSKIATDSEWFLPRKFHEMKRFWLAAMSSKTAEEWRRGSGLTLNRWIMREGGGDLKIRETSERGTVFEIIIPVKERQ